VVGRRPGDEHIVWPASVQDLLPYFLYSLDLDPDFTLGDLFHLLDRDDVGLLAEVLDEDVVPVLDEARQGSVEPDHNDPLHFLRVSNRHEQGYLRRELDAWGTWDQPHDDAAGKAGPRDTWMSVSLTPVGQLLHLPIRYDPELVFRNQSFEIEYRTSVDVTLIEFLKAVFDDLTFHGSPDERDEVLRSLKHQVELIERDEARLIPAEEVFRELREKYGADDEV
jgi:hypothetical protein